MNNQNTTLPVKDPLDGMIGDGRNKKPVVDESKINETPAKPKVEEKEETIAVPVKKLQSLMDRVEALENGSPAQELERSKYHIAHMRLYEGLPIIRFGKNWTERKLSDLNPEDESRLFTTVYCINKDGKETDFKVDYLLLMETGEKINVKIIKKNIKKDISSAGVHGIINPDPHKNKSFISHKEDLVVKTEIASFDVEVLEGDMKGKELTVDDKILNI